MPKLDETRGLFARLKKTRESLAANLSGLLQSGPVGLDDKAVDDLTDQLIQADLGVEASTQIVTALRQQAVSTLFESKEYLNSALKTQLLEILKPSVQPLDLPATSAKPRVVLMVGVNGVGKTTTIGKIASQYVEDGKKVLLGAGDTFRAAAIEQLQQWAERAGCDFVSKEAGSDPSSVMYETISKAVSEDYDVVICDTAGRLHTKKNLMEELKKMVRVIRKQIPEAPHQILLVLDASTGQNAIFQTREFLEATELTGLVITKLDGTSKGGVIIGIVNEFDVPVRYIGIGEQIRDLRPFDPKAFADSLFI